MTETERALDHLARRWNYLGPKGYHGVVTREQFFSANMHSVKVNIRIGLVSRIDGSGWDDPKEFQR